MLRTIALLLIAGALQAATLTVSPGGPLRSPAAARDAVRQMRRSGSTGPVTILVREGTYYLSEPLELGAEDSNVTWQGQPGERAILSGGRPITGWTRARANIWTAPSGGVFRQLFVNGRRAQRARTPNQGFYRIDGPSSQDKPFLLRYRGGDIRREWAGRGVEVIALLAWAEIRMPIVDVDEGGHIARLAGNPRPSNKERDARYWIENAPDGLDSAGEFLVDGETVSYWPVTGEQPDKDLIIAPALTQLVRIDGARNVTFRGLDFRHTEWTIGPKGYADTQAAIEAASAFEAVNAEDVAVEHCSFSQMGGYAIWFGRGSRRNRVAGNRIFDMGGGGVKIGETVQRTEEADRNFEHVVRDNDINRLGRVYPAAVGIWVGQSSRNTLAHNHIHDLYYTAISVGWTWGYGPNLCKGNLIEYNHLHHIGLDMLSDMGAIYTLGIQPGTVIRNNLIHDVRSFTYGGWGIYPDEGSSQMLIENNVVYRTKSAGFHQHYGRENLVRNNIFAFGHEYQLMRTRAEPHLSFTFEGNIVYFDSGKLLGGNWTGAQFKMDRNVYWDERGGVSFAGRSAAEWKEQGQDPGSVVADPLFENASNYDFRLRAGSPAIKLGFQAIDTSSVGPRVRAGLP
ncbi:MAG: right-handed parallel beta-helix repeat-containing protein [Bryobacteraceae bacterium]